LSFSGYSQSNRWESVGTANEGQVKIYYDNESLNYYMDGSNNMVKVWIKYIYDPPVKYESLNSPIKEFRELVKFNLDFGWIILTPDYVLIDVSGKSWEDIYYGLRISGDALSIVVPGTIYEKTYTLVKR